MAEEISNTQNASARRTWIMTGVAVALIALSAGGLIYWYVTSQRLYVDAASIEAPQINLAPSHAGILEDVYVKEGDEISANTSVARVGDELIESKVAGIVVTVPNTVGAQVNSNQPVVTMIDPTQLRVVGQVDEDKGLNRLQVGNPVSFTVDAFGGKVFSAIVDEISPTSQESQVVFNISDQRQEKKFDVKARFDTSAYPELKNGMSARMWIYTQ